MRIAFGTIVAGLIALGASLTTQAEEFRGTVQRVQVTEDAYSYGFVTVRTPGGSIRIELLSQSGGPLTALRPETAAMVIAVASVYPDSINFLNIYNNSGYYCMHAGSAMYVGWYRGMAFPSSYTDSTSGRIAYISVFGDPTAGAYATITMTRVDGGTTWVQLRTTSETVNGYTYPAMTSQQAVRVVQSAAGGWFLRFTGHFTRASTNSNVVRLQRGGDVYTSRD